MHLKEITIDAVSYLMNGLHLEVIEVESDFAPYPLLTFTDGEEAYRTSGEIENLLIEHGYNGSIWIEPLGVFHGNELVY